ncbi:hypothetical protein ABI_14980 [Asticcacaulis biprosthecium C19]|uniref:Uncharacterized protein n=1 Tax=Asticcacaulis biprosthecium C19 TaxID=715226 RepID=F4QIZ6_9CAUL|nr:hypothetical protein [Asticcacaulis biprosthecium]EGF93059.1 hypothetical protein ABI_14980 [Asticcacaulis biprosthecium C19]
MGLEADSVLITADGQVAVKALLETHELILRGGFRKTFARKDILHPRGQDDRVLFEYGGGTWTLALPPGKADTWVKKLTTPLPTLAAKLGVDAAHRVLVRGDISDPALAEALDGAVTVEPAQAAQGVIVALSEDDLTTALSELTALLPAAALWIIYPKGSKSALPEAVVRQHLHGVGYVDTKTSGVSDVLTALRFSKRK